MERAPLSGTTRTVEATKYGSSWLAAGGGCFATTNKFTKGGSMRAISLASTAALAGAIMLSGCGKKADNVSLKNASVETVANTAQDAVKLQPGQWEMTFAIDKMEMPGMPAGANPAAQPPQKASTCITPEQAAKP